MSTNSTLFEQFCDIVDECLDVDDSEQYVLLNDKCEAKGLKTRKEILNFLSSLEGFKFLQSGL